MVAASSLQRKLNGRYKMLIFCFFSVFFKLLSCEATCVINFFFHQSFKDDYLDMPGFLDVFQWFFRVFNFLQKQILSGFFRNFQGSHLQIHLTLVLFYNITEKVFPSQQDFCQPFQWPRFLKLLSTDYETLKSYYGKNYDLVFTIITLIFPGISSVGISHFLFPQCSTKCNATKNCF